MEQKRIFDRRNKGGRPKKGAADKLKYRLTVKMATSDYYTLKGKYNPQIQIFAESETKRPFFECSFKTKRTKKDLRTTQTIKPEIRAKITLFRALSNTIQQAI